MLGTPNVLSSLESARRDYDTVLVDGPCSSSGVWRRWPSARWEFEVESLPGLARDLKGLIEEGKERVKVNGRIVYCTCSIFREENEDVLWASCI